MSNSDKLSTLKELAEAAGWTNQESAEAFLTEVNRMWNRGQVTDALTELADGYRADMGLAPRAECTERISYADPIHPEGCYVIVQLLDGKIESLEMMINRKPAAKSLAAAIRVMASEANMAKYRKAVA